MKENPKNNKINPPNQSLILGIEQATDARLVPMMEWFEKNKPLIEGKRILDIGSNAGFFPSLYARLGASSVVAVEPRRCFESFFFENEKEDVVQKVNWFSCDIRKFFPPRCDVVSCLGLIYHMSDGLKQLQRILEQSDANTLFLDTMIWPNAHRKIETARDNSNCWRPLEFILCPSIKSVEQWLDRIGFRHSIVLKIGEAEGIRNRAMWFAHKNKIQAV